MWNGHGRGADGGLAVDLCVVSSGNGGVVAAEPNAADGEAGVAASFGDTGFLEQGKRAASCAEEYEVGGNTVVVAGLFIFYFEVPMAVVAVQVLDTAGIANGEAFFFCELVEEEAGERAVVDVGAGDHLCGGDYFAVGAAFHDQGEPFFQLLGIHGEFHAVVVGMCSERGVALFKEGCVVGAAYEAEVGHGVDKGPGVFDGAFCHQV